VKGTLRKELWNTMEKQINEVTKAF
jgi:hypothetical protein